jgi:sugar phosphate isomerase/epimerase
MQLSCLPVSFFSDIIEGRMSVGQWARMGAEIGLDAIDLSTLFFPDRSPRAIAAVRQEIEAAGMRVAMVTSYPDFTHPDPLQRQRELELEQEVIALAASLGARLVRVTAGQAHPETDRAAGIAWAVEGLRRLAETAGNLGPRLVYENHGKPGAWRYTDFSQPPDIFLEIARATADTALGINFDTANATAFAEDPLALLNEVVGRVVSVHAADTAVRGELRAVLLGTGVTPFSILFQRLHQAAWDGWICIEEASRQGRQGVEAAARFVRRMWQETANSRG